MKNSSLEDSGYQKKYFIRKDSDYKKNSLKVKFLKRRFLKISQKRNVKGKDLYSSFSNLLRLRSL